MNKINKLIKQEKKEEIFTLKYPVLLTLIVIIVYTSSWIKPIFNTIGFILITIMWAKIIIKKIIRLKTLDEYYRRTNR